MLARASGQDLSSSEQTDSSSMGLEGVTKELEELGYQFNDVLQLRQVANGEPFEFTTQSKYEQLADLVADCVQELMIAEYKMRREYLPIPRMRTRASSSSGEESEGVPIYVSENIEEADAVLILLCGSGAVAAGQWARRLCINDSLNEGAVFPFLEWAQERGIGIVILNPNFRLEGGPRMSAETHVVQAWDNVISQLPAKHFAMVAHSYGGVCTCRLLSVREEEVLQRLRCVAFTDSVHGTWGPDILKSAGKRFFARNCVNWVQSEEPLNTLVAHPYLPEEDREMETASGRIAAEPKAEPMSAFRGGGPEVAGKKGGWKTSGTRKKEKEVSAAALDQTAAGLGFFEEGAVEVEREEASSGSEKIDAGVEGIQLNLADKQGMADAIEKESDPNMKRMLRTLAGESGPPEEGGAGPSGDVSKAHSDVSEEHGNVSKAHAGPFKRGEASKRGSDEGGRQKRKKGPFSWANLGRNEEHCRCLELSAGIDEHEKTTFYALESVTDFLEKKLTEAGSKVRRESSMEVEESSEEEA